MRPVFGLKKVWMRRKAARGVWGIFLTAALAANILPAGGMTVHASEKGAEVLGLSESGEMEDDGVVQGSGELPAEVPGDAAAAYSLAAERSGELDFSQNVNAGDLDTDHYQWDAGSKTLKLKDADIRNTVLLPDDTVTIEIEGNCSIDGLGINKDPNQTHLTFSGTGELTIENPINLSGGNGNILTVERDAHVIAKGGISIGASGGVDSTVTVKGTLTAGSTAEYNNAIYAGKVVVSAGGFLNVSGKTGVVLNGMTVNGSGSDFTGVFIVERGGCFTADCENFNVRVQSGGRFPDGSNADKAISIPEGYLPKDCEVKPSEGVIDFVKKDTDIVYTGPMSIHENHDWLDEWKKDETAHWKACRFAGCDKVSEYAPHSFDNATLKCTACGAVLAVSWNNADQLIYNGQEQKPGFTVTVDSIELDTSKYNTEYRDNTNAGEASVIITGKDDLSFEQTLTFQIAKAAPRITWGGDTQTVVYSGKPAKIEPPTVTLVNGESFKGEISYSYAANSRAGYTSGLPTDAGTYSVKAGIEEQGNYTAAESTVALTVEQAEYPPNRPSDIMNVARKYDKVSSVELPENWQWEETDRDTPLEINVQLPVTAVYEGADKANYKNVTCAVTITRADCDHESTELRNAVAATCQQKGYSGDLWCLECGELLTKGRQTELTDHSGGTATCISGKVCEVCKTEYTEKDSTNHMHTEVRGEQSAACTKEGYTGDEFCTDCDTQISSGSVIAATGHDWNLTGEEAATTTSEGKRIYTCSKCNETRQEAIPKLPEENHEHDYTSAVVKEASCTEAGERKYTCVCGDSYTESIPAHGHSYQSKVTKQPTVSEEGVRTYTCSRCNDTYTESIEKLTDNRPSEPVKRPEDGRPSTGDESDGEGREPSAGDEADGEADRTEAESPQTGQRQMPWQIGAAMLMIALCAGGVFVIRFFVIRRKKD